MEIIEVFDRYLQGRMTPAEQKRFFKSLRKDPSKAEQFFTLALSAREIMKSAAETEKNFGMAAASMSQEEFKAAIDKSRQKIAAEQRRARIADTLASRLHPQQASHDAAASICHLHLTDDADYAVAADYDMDMAADYDMELMDVAEPLDRPSLGIRRCIKDVSYDRKEKKAPCEIEEALVAEPDASEALQKESSRLSQPLRGHVRQKNKVAAGYPMPSQCSASKPRSQESERQEAGMGAVAWTLIGIAVVLIVLALLYIFL